MFDDDILADDDGSADISSRPDDRPLNPFRFPVRVAARHLVTLITQQVDEHVQSAKPRKRRRRANDATTFEASVTAVASDLIHHCLIGDTEGISISRSNDWPAPRYKTAVHNKLLSGILDALAEGGLGYVSQRLGQRGFEPGQAHLTSLRPTAKLIELVHSSGVEEEDFDTLPAGEAIHLIGPKVKGQPSPLLDYVETYETTRLRGDLKRLNDRLRAADLTVDEAELRDEERRPDLSKRHLVRRFTQGNFDSGGRLWGGFWQSMPKDLRRRTLTIDGEATVELDFGQAGARILYGIARAPAPDTDLYSVPGLEGQREGVKKVLSAAMFVTTRPSRMPRGARALFRSSTPFATALRAIEEFHRPIAHLFFTGIGHRAQRIESDIIVEVVLALADQGTIALPIHDAVIVPRSAALRASGVMLEVFHRAAGIAGQVSSFPPDVLGHPLEGEEHGEMTPPSPL